MWTPKRVLLLLAGFALFFTGYEVYANLLGFGGIDGLTPLPEAYWPGPPVDEKDLPPRRLHVNEIDRKLVQAFGEACPELKRILRLEVPDKGLVLAFDDYEIPKEPDNHHVILKPFSIAIFGKTREPGAYPEINTVRSREATLDLDGPIKTIYEINKRKIIGGKIKDDVELINNRRTPQRTDDLTMYTTGTVYYDEATHHIWTPEPIKLTDEQSKPQPTTITATGMDVYLRAEPNTPKVGEKDKRKGKEPAERITDVDRVEFRSAVRMDLWVEGNGGFLASGKPADKPKPAGPPSPAKATGPTPPPERSKIVITTDGKFCYDLTTNRARFDIPLRASRHPEIVRVVRESEQDPTRRDQLECDHLELQFQNKNQAGSGRGTRAASLDDRSSNSNQIESAHAWGKDLTLTSDAEALTAFGNDLVYQAKTRQSVLKGSPQMVAMKDGNEIHARELWLATDAQTETREATAIGPGEISMLERTAEGHMERTLKAYWQDRLIHRKDGTFDCLTLTGSAAFEDPEHAQRLRADCLKVWLEPNDSGKAPGKEPKQTRPHHVEAKGHVVADAPELKIQEPTENLVIWFRDAQVKAELPAAAPPVVAGSPDPTTGPTAGLPQVPGDLRSDRVAQSGDRATTRVPPPAPPARTEYVAGKLPPPPPPAGPPVAAAPAATQPEKPKKPLQLSARSVEAHVLRAGPKNDLERLWCEGTVHVHQEPESPDDQGTDIQGDTLQLNNAPDGGIMVVTGKMAQVNFDKLGILGPEVFIDQRSNQAWVHGIGAMQVLTDHDFDGNKLARPTTLTIHWRDAMLFRGKNAEFSGAVEAFQDNSRLLCQEMQVEFDRPVSLKEGNKGGPSPKVDRLLCDKQVQIEETTPPDKTRPGPPLEGYKRLRAPEVDIDNAEKVVVAPGPGEVRMFQPGSTEEAFPKTAAPQAAPRGGAPAPAPKGGKGAKKEPKEEFKITHVRYRDSMRAQTKEGRKATFYGDVDAVNVPSDQPDLVIDIDKPPPGCFYLHADRLTVFSTPLPDGRNNQQMIAEGKVLVRAQEFWGIAQTVKYDEAQDRVIFEGGSGGRATVYQSKTPGGPQDKLSGKKIYYWRRTNDFNVDDSDGLTTH